MTIQEIDKQIIQLEAQRRELYKAEIAEFQEKAKANIGRCFVTNGQYVKVIDIPQVTTCRGGIDFNEYQYPAVFLCDDVIPFYEDTLFSGAWGEGHPFTKELYKEITPDEFNAEFEKKIQQLRNTILKVDVKEE